MELIEYIDKGIILDEAQRNALDKITPISDRLSKSSIISKLFKKNNYSGIYIYGPVGRGKTIIVKAFFESIKTDKKAFYHYQSFLRYLHQESHKFFKNGVQDYVNEISCSLAKKFDLIVIDELEIRDITDAMLIQRVSDILINNGVFLVFTSNINPQDLYLNGLQRELFFPFIGRVHSEFLIIHLDNLVDYRFRKIADTKPIIFEGENPNNEEAFEEIISSLVGGQGLYEGEIEIFGRKVKFENTLGNILFTSSEEIIDRELSYNDFIAVCEKYNAIIFKSMSKIPDDSNKAIRFINFIDNLYASKVLFVAYFGYKISEFCMSKKLEQEFKRTISRIAEMSCVDYIKKSKYYGANNV